jgi:hypothetical protein
MLVRKIAVEGKPSGWVFTVMDAMLVAVGQQTILTCRWFIPNVPSNFDFIRMFVIG